MTVSCMDCLLPTKICDGMGDACKEHHCLYLCIVILTVKTSVSYKVSNMCNISMVNIESLYHIWRGATGC